VFYIRLAALAPRGLLRTAWQAEIDQTDPSAAAILFASLAVTIIYSRPQDLVAADQGQFANGGVLAQVEGDFVPGDMVELVVHGPGGQASLEATVLQVLAGAGVALAFTKSAELNELIDDARGREPCDGPDPEHRISKADDERGQALSPFQRIKTASMTEKIQMAKHGSKSERAAVIRDPNKSLHQYVIRNPHLQLDEVGQMARMTAVSTEVLKYIAEKREWYQRPEIAAALARNPRTPVPIAARVLRHVSKNELRQLAKGNGVRSAVAAAARKLLLR
jgi:hypothetical protein